MFFDALLTTTSLLGSSSIPSITFPPEISTTSPTQTPPEFNTHFLQLTLQGMEKPKLGPNVDPFSPVKYLLRFWVCLHFPQS